jgi:hypothetical protein
MSIALLIPSTSRNRQWATIQQSYLYNVTLKTFMLTYDKQREYCFYIGIDRNDPIYDNEENQAQLVRLCSIANCIKIRFIYMDSIPKGHLTIMWNRLFEEAHKEGHPYFFQCGDDIEFVSKGWIGDCIQKLQENHDIGVTGPINNNNRILTQSFVSRKHMDLFGYYFPPSIINWCCDDWINFVYQKLGYFFPLRHHFCKNIGGPPRYNINNETFTSNLQLQQKVYLMRQHADDLATKDCERARKQISCIVEK